MKKILITLFSAVALIFIVNSGALDVPVSAATSGTTGDCTWSLDGTVLTISGNGDMNECYEYYQPWDRSITQVIIEDGVTSIGESAFYKCSKLTSITIGNSVTSIGSSAFYKCSSLTSITIPDSVTSIGWGAFDHCTSLKSITIGNSVTSIGYNAFCYCTSLTSITIPDSVTSIGSSAFSVCSSLTSITIPDSVTSIDSGAFSNCTSLKSITIPDSVTSIGYSAFSNCTSLKSITIPDSVTSIGSRAFDSCKSLESITIPNSVKSIGDEAFFNCFSLVKVNITDIAAWCNIDFYSCGSNPLSYAENLYLNGNLITNLVIPDSVTSIGDWAFYNCSRIKSITIPNSVTSIGSSAFSGCTSLESIAIGNGVKGIGNYAFYNCTSLESITLPFVGEKADGTGYSNFGYIFGANDETYPYYDNAEYVPNSLKTVVITGSNSITNNAFYGCNGLISVRFTGKVGVIGEWAFSGCSVLREVLIPAECKRISPMAFYDCINLKNVYYTGTATQRSNLSISHGNDIFKVDALWHYNSCPKGGNHKYSNACDISCNECDTIREVNHNYSSATCTAPKTCKVCKATSGKALGHKYTKVTTRAATTSKNGYVLTECSVCGKDKSKTTIYYPKTVKLSTTSYAYDGKTKKPSVTVKDSKGKTISSKYYTVTYASGRKNVGKYKVTVKFKGNYSGTKTLYFEINPGKTTLKKVTGASKSIKVTVNKKTTQVSGYQIQYSTSKKFTSAKTKTISSAKTTSTTIKSLKAKKTYYVRVRTYKTVSGKKYYSGWSTYKSTKTK